MEETAEHPRGFRLSRKKIRPEPAGIFSAREKSVLGPRFLAMSPVIIFMLNILSAGLRSTFWLINRMPSILMMAKPEEKNIKFPVVFWLASYFTSLALTAAGALKFAVWRLDPAAIPQSRVFQAMIAAWSLSFLLNRYLLYWSREAIIDELQKNRFDAVKSRAVTFAHSPLMIWFFGVSYIQAHINRMIKKKGLKTYRPPLPTRVRKNAPPPKKREPEPQQGDRG
jgi:hypothetical protein